jgi:hypothetical protein
LRDDMDTFSGPHFAEMFARWRPPATKIFAPKLPPRRCRTIAACTEKATDLDALERLHNDVDRAPWRERSKKGPFTSVSMEEFTKDSLRSPCTRAIRPGPWRMDPCFGVRGAAGATPVSVGCAATKPFRPRFAPRGSLPPLPHRTTRAIRSADRIENCYKFEGCSPMSLSTKPSSREHDQNLSEHVWASPSATGKIMASRVNRG